MTKRDIRGNEIERIYYEHDVIIERIKFINDYKEGKLVEIITMVGWDTLYKVPVIYEDNCSIVKYKPYKTLERSCMISKHCYNKNHLKEETVETSCDGEDTTFHYKASFNESDKLISTVTRYDQAAYWKDSMIYVDGLLTESVSKKYVNDSLTGAVLRYKYFYVFE